MANTFSNTSWVSREALELVQPNLVIARSINTDYSAEFGKEGMKVGDTINVPLPQNFAGRSGAAVSVENLSNVNTPVVLNVQYGVDFQVTSKELKLNLTDATKRYIKPAMKNIAAYIDRTVGQVMSATCPLQVGTAGTAFTDASFLDNAKILLDDNEAPFDDERFAILDTRQESIAVRASRGYFNDQAELSKQYKTNRMGTSYGFNFAMSQNLPRVTTGTYSGTPIVAGAAQTGSSINLSGLTSGNTINAGDRFTLAGVFGVENIGKSSQPALQQFTVTSGATVAGGGTVTLNIYPAITVTGQYQNVSNSPANSAAVTFLNASATVGSRGFAFHKDAYTIAFAKLDEPKAVESCTSIVDEETGVAIRSMVFYDGRPDVWIYRFDTLFAVSPLYPEWAVNIVS